MRKNLEHFATVATSKNDLIEFAKTSNHVIVVSNELLCTFQEEVNSDIKENSKTSTLTKAGIVAGIGGFLLSAHPIGWLIGGAVATTIGIVTKDKSELGPYKIYFGKDSLDADIAVFINEDIVSLKHDKIIYPNWVKSVNTKKEIKKLKIKKK